MTQNLTIMLALTTLAVVLLTAVVNGAKYNPTCPNYGSELGQSCEKDKHCIGQAAVCRKSKCTCHENYYQVSKNKKKKCIRAPDTVGASCKKGRCGSPLTCENGKCRCTGRFRTKGNICVLGNARSKRNSRCSRSTPCVEPFQTCKNGRCDSIDGARWDGSRYSVVPICPDGSKAGGKCNAGETTEDILENTENNEKGVLGDCRRGSYCVTDGISKQGFCCKALCPFGEPRRGANCDPGNSKISCPMNTHYCHKVVGPSFGFSLCCPKPCADPTPVYHDGKCYTSAVHNGAYHSDERRRGGLCEVDAQCDGGESMTCSRSSGYCECKEGHYEAKDKRKVQYTCVIACKPGQGAVDTMCMGLAGLGKRCYQDWQCGYKVKNSVCHSGKCHCKCGYEYKKGRCRELPESQKPKNKNKKPSILENISNLLSGSGGGSMGSGGLLGGLLGSLTG